MIYVDRDTIHDNNDKLFWYSTRQCRVEPQNQIIRDNGGYSSIPMHFINLPVNIAELSLYPIVICLTHQRCSRGKHNLQSTCKYMR